jgi:hypothetical protein
MLHALDVKIQYTHCVMISEKRFCQNLVIAIKIKLDVYPSTNPVLSLLRVACVVIAQAVTKEIVKIIVY